MGKAFNTIRAIAQSGTAQASEHQCECCHKTFGTDCLWTCERCGEHVCSGCVAQGQGVNPEEHDYEMGMGLCVRCRNKEYSFNMATGQIEIRPCDHVR